MNIAIRLAYSQCQNLVPTNFLEAAAKHQATLNKKPNPKMTPKKRQLQRSMLTTSILVDASALILFFYPRYPYPKLTANSSPVFCADFSPWHVDQVLAPYLSQRWLLSPSNHDGGLMDRALLCCSCVDGGSFGGTHHLNWELVYI